MIIAALVFLPFVFALLMPFAVRKNAGDKAALLLMLGYTALALLLLGQMNSHLAIGKLMGQGLSFHVDGFRMVFALLTVLLWLSSLAFTATGYVKYRQDRYYTFTFLTLGAVMGVFLSADLFTTFCFFEVMSFTSFVWVIHDETEKAIWAGKLYLAVAVIGGLVLLVGLLLLQNMFGTLDLAVLRDRIPGIADKGMLYAAAICIFVGFGAKAGAFPLHVWMPTSYPEAPAPASALLSGMLSKAGVLGLIVITAVLLPGDILWGKWMLIIGLVTALAGAAIALFADHFKRILAGSSMSQIGFIIVGIGMMGILGADNAIAARGTMLHMINHSLIKLVLFLISGAVFMKLGVLTLNEARGFGKNKPLLKFCFLAAALSVAGVPLMSGYVSKTLLHEAIVEAMHMHLMSHGFLQVCEILFLTAGGCTAAYMTKLFMALFVEENEDQAKMDAISTDYLSLPAKLAIIVPALLLPLMGVVPNMIMDPLAELGMSYMNGGELHHAVHYFTWVNLKGSLISLSIGAVLYLLLVRKGTMAEGRYVDRWPKVGLERNIYRPLVMQVLPFLGALVARVISSWPDAIIRFCQKRIFNGKWDSADPTEDVYFSLYPRLPKAVYYRDSLSATLLCFTFGMAAIVIVIIFL
ncbi:MAG: sodium:proton antiporter [Firmicutes bacterium]|nr:sodium:proton antiporter [Bacillota bacterium]